ncbi:hypothetical protein O7622_26710 [Micromonospora sp. WMMD1076]|uniref:hypothetical protein n=1 Tax=Micromonospora sp. WMMD1076 TaxID=3016103 RepID=UPI00249CAE78|nr:hypothetical protein [Micromonospora sp. WMMD1076]WFF06595.1 hypothetical protein O7622_26710 [Micromonospora sp. WMMD1076]
MNLYARLALRFAVYHRALLTAVLCTMLVLSAFAGALAIFDRSAREAVATSVRADSGGKRYALQVLTPGPVAGLLAADPALHPVWDDDGSVTVGGRQSPASVRLLRDPLPVGVLTQGAFPARDDEATISTHLAGLLGVSVGDTVTVSASGPSREVRVSGITSRPEDRSYRGVVLLGAGLPAGDADLWLTDRRPFSDPTLEPLLQRGDLAARTTSILAQDRAAGFQSALLSTTRQVSRVVVVLGAVMALLLLVVTSRATRREVAALTAVGIRESRARLLPIAMAVLAIVGGAVLGAALALVVLSRAASGVAGLVGQEWSGVVVPWSSLSAVLAVVVAGAAVGVSVAVWGRRYRPRYGPSWRSRPRLAISLTALGLACMLLPFVDVLPVEAAVPGAVLLALTVPAAMVPISTARAAPASRRLVLALTTPFALAGALTSLLALGTAYYSAYITHAGIASVRSSPAVQPTGSYLVYNVPAPAGEALRDEYRRLGGSRTATYQLPVEDTHTLRVSGERAVGCMRASGGNDPMDHLSCLPKDTSSPVNIVALSSALGDGEARADPGLIEGDRVGLIDFDLDTSAVKSLETVPATGDETLGGNMPGLVVAPDSDIAKRYGLRASDAVLVALLDFGTLDEAAQARFRATVARLAATGQTSELVGQKTPELAVGVWTAAAGAAAVCLLWVSVGTVISTSQLRQRAMYAAAGAGRRHRRLLAARLMAPPFAGFLLTGVIAICAAWISGVHDGSPFGWWWMLPSLAGMAAVLVVGGHYARPVRPPS